VTPASVHDSQLFDELLDQSEEPDGNKRTVFADSVRPSRACPFDKLRTGFGAQAAMGGHLVRTIGLQRAKLKIGLMNLVYNMIRLIQLIKRDVKSGNCMLMDNHRGGAPIRHNKG
jgi:transposase, IS5 family